MTKMSDFSRDKEICMNYGDNRERFEGAVVPPTFGNNLFVYSNFEDLSKAVLDEQHYYVYTRGTNPTVEIAEKKLAALERGEQCKCFSSGMAAICAAIFSSVKSGDHVLLVGNVYFSTVDFVKYLKKFKVEYSVVYSTNLEAIEAAIRPNTAIIYIESPSDMNFRLVDLAAVSAMAKGKGIRTIMDNTWATPLFQKPLTKGIDIVVHSASKYLGGHSDVMGGALITNKETMKKIYAKEFLLMGGILAPFEASQLLKGLRTLPFRMKEHEENAIKIARFLETHAAISKVNYPGLESHPDYRLGKMQLTGYTGLMSFELKEANYEAVKTVIDTVKVIRIGVSWGSFESLMMSPNIGSNAGQLKTSGISPGTIRLAVGLEDIALLLDDLKQALDRLI